MFPHTISFSRESTLEGISVGENAVIVILLSLDLRHCLNVVQNRLYYKTGLKLDCNTILQQRSNGGFSLGVVAGTPITALHFCVVTQLTNQV